MKKKVVEFLVDFWKAIKFVLFIVIVFAIAWIPIVLAVVVNFWLILTAIFFLPLAMVILKRGL